MDCHDIPVLAFTVGSSQFFLAPENGFCLMRWQVNAITGKRDILYWPEGTCREACSGIHGGNPLLFPFCGRSFDRGVEGYWRSPDGDRLPMPIHGFAHQSRFQIISQSDNQITGELIPGENALAAYPFEYKFRVTYTFSELSLVCEMALQNRDHQPLPWSAGHHFHFTLPWHKGARRADYRLNMEARKSCCQGPDGKLVPGRGRETCHEFSDTELIDRIHWHLRHDRVSFGPKGGEEDIHLIIGDNPVPPKNHAIVTWTEADAPYYCIEPWMGPPNAAEHGKGLHWVQPGETESFRVEVSLF